MPRQTFLAKLPNGKYECVSRSVTAHGDRQCGDCGKTFTNSAGLGCHKLTHRGEAKRRRKTEPAARPQAPRPEPIADEDPVAVVFDVLVDAHVLNEDAEDATHYELYDGTYETDWEPGGESNVAPTETEPH